MAGNGVLNRGMTHYTDSKLPKIAAAFWVMKISATTLGETAGDLLSMTLNVGYASSSLILVSGFFLSLIAQLMSKSVSEKLTSALGGR
jgi:uncharacterized membrane-anchored protein